MNMVFILTLFLILVRRVSAHDRSTPPHLRLLATCDLLPRFWNTRVYWPKFWDDTEACVKGNKRYDHAAKAFHGVTETKEACQAACAADTTCAFFSWYPRTSPTGEEPFQNTSATKCYFSPAGATIAAAWKYAGQPFSGPAQCTLGADNRMPSDVYRQVCNSARG